MDTFIFLRLEFQCWRVIKGYAMIRRAQEAESNVLTRISFASKAFWGYPEEYFVQWAEELTLSKQYIRDNEVFVYEDGGLIKGYYSLVENGGYMEIGGIGLEKGTWLDHFFIEPDSIGRGIGSLLFAHLRQRCRINRLSTVRILADPHSRGFYEKMDCRYQGEYPSTIAGRTTPYFLLEVD